MSAVFNVLIQLVLNSSVFSVNTALILYCVCHRILHKEIVLTLFLCFADGIAVGANVYTNARKMWIYSFLNPMTMISSWDCFRMGYSSLFLFSYPYTGSADLLFSAEKMVMIMWPGRYRVIQRKHVFCVLIVLTLVCASATGSVAVSWSHLDPWNVTILCNAEHIPPHLRMPLTISRMVTMTLSVVVYLPVVFMLIKIRRRTDKNEVQGREYDSKTLRMAMHSSFLLLAVFVAIVIPDIIILVFKEFYLKHQLIFFNIGSLKPLCNVVFAISVLRTLRSKKQKALMVAQSSMAQKSQIPSRFRD